VVANVASGSVGPDAADRLAEIFRDAGIAAHICAPEAGELENCLRAAIDAKPDLLVVLAGDGTARAAAELAGPKGPLLAPLAGGTMNMLPHAVYGARPWQEALREVLAHGEARVLGGGEVEGRKFLCGAILGSPALLAPAREAMREGQLRLAWSRTRRAFDRAFTGRLRYNLDGAGRAKAEALIVMCPVASRALDAETQALEAAALDVRGAGQVLRLGLNAVIGDWRTDPAVEAQPARRIQIWSARSIPAILDGESVRLARTAEIRFVPAVCRVLAPPRAKP
jgi:diacylglycerol kinase family enzyme